MVQVPPPQPKKNKVIADHLVLFLLAACGGWDLNRSLRVTDERSSLGSAAKNITV